MPAHADVDQQSSPTPPRRDPLGLLKSVVEFFTSMTGMATAALGLLAAVAAITFIPPAANPGPLPPGGPGVTEPTPSDSDSDSDGVLDAVDNCDFVANKDQENFNGTGRGDACDPDDDNDKADDDVDAFPHDRNEQSDSDSDGAGDNADQDDDNDGTGDASDAFPLDPDESIDNDGDGIGANVDPDDFNADVP